MFLFDKAMHLDLTTSRLPPYITEYSATKGSSSFSRGQWEDMDVARLLLALEQGTRSLEDYIQEYLDIFMEYALLCVGSSFTVGVAEEERDNAVMVAIKFSQPQALGHSSILIATPVIKPAREIVATHIMARAHIMTATTTLRHVTAAIPESRNVTAVFPESSQVRAALPKSSQVTAVVPVSSQVTAVFPESSQVRASPPKSSYCCCSLWWAPALSAPPWRAPAPSVPPWWTPAPSVPPWRAPGPSALPWLAPGPSAPPWWAPGLSVLFWWPSALPVPLAPPRFPALLVLPQSPGPTWTWPSLPHFVLPLPQHSPGLS
ncbi:Protein piccolo [Labeo rohita]|uniref:Protein piccolo n=1 Tax=Labeo rohita TaxID=84645 RepID=A0ABQ8LYL9_LABRO|nr:Protein piccolo [Labeo rohita]